ncbi:hypothetical protein B0T10DRAFT_379275, partial [Thelonectria olida]
LLSYEDEMPHPKMSFVEGYDQRVLDSHLCQLYLRTHLNSTKKGPKEEFRNVSLVANAV